MFIQSSGSHTHNKRSLGLAHPALGDRGVRAAESGRCTWKLPISIFYLLWAKKPRAERPGCMGWQQGGNGVFTVQQVPTSEPSEVPGEPRWPATASTASWASSTEFKEKASRQVKSRSQTSRKVIQFGRYLTAAFNRLLGRFCAISLLEITTHTRQLENKFLLNKHWPLNCCWKTFCKATRPHNSICKVLEAGDKGLRFNSNSHYSNKTPSFRLKALFANFICFTEAACAFKLPRAQAREDSYQLIIVFQLKFNQEKRWWTVILAF